MQGAFPGEHYENSIAWNLNGDEELSSSLVSAAPDMADVHAANTSEDIQQCRHHHQWITRSAPPPSRELCELIDC